ncbi:MULTISPECIES: hypothetical protein [unclassified Streptomyces]|uniref:hypothetical protein n=1 Tax=unclassified Streptomyces TaxID=2593676 RepID=UPI00363EA5CE
MHADGYPSFRLPLLLAAFQHRFHRDLDAMIRHLVDDVAVGWEELGSDLLQGAPPALAEALTAGENWPSRTLNPPVTPGDTARERPAVTHETALHMDVEWGYVLHPQGIEVINVLTDECGPVVDWDTDCLTTFDDAPDCWIPDRPAPTLAPPPSCAARPVPVPAPAKGTVSHAAPRR